MKIRIYIIAGLILFFNPLNAAKLIKIGIIDRDYLMLRFADGEVSFIDDGLGEGAFETRNDAQNEIVITFGLPLDLGNALNPANFMLTSADDPNYGNTGLNPVACHRKSKINGMAQLAWKGNDYDYVCPMVHTIYLKLPKSLEQGKSYSVYINPVTNTHLSFCTFTLLDEARNEVAQAGWPINAILRLRIGRNPKDILTPAMFGPILNLLRSRPCAEKWPYTATCTGYTNDNTIKELYLIFLLI